jgi:hypothetical protein
LFKNNQQFRAQYFKILLQILRYLKKRYFNAFFYNKSLKNYKFKNLLDIITSNENIMLAYRNIKKNKGSSTKGANENYSIHYFSVFAFSLTSFYHSPLVDYLPPLDFHLS